MNDENEGVKDNDGFSLIINGYGVFGKDATKIEALINSRVVEELESLREQFTEKIADPFKADDWQGNRLRNEQLLKMIDITKDRISELTKGGNDEA